VDDFLLFSDDKSALACMLDAIGEFLCSLRLRVHPRKSRVYRTSEGFTFLGWRIFPDRLRLCRANVVRFRRRLRLAQESYTRGNMPLDDVTARIRAWVAHAAHGDTWRLRRQLFEQAVFQRVERDLNCAAVPGTTMPGTRASRTVTGTSQATGMTT
jgi:hypothetical protein